MTKEEVLETIAPPRHVSEKIIRYLEKKCIDFSFRNNIDSIVVQGPAYCAEMLFGLPLVEYRNIETGKKIVRTANVDKIPTLPDELQQYVSHISGLTGLPPQKKTRVMQVGEQTLKNGGTKLKQDSKLKKFQVPSGYENFGTNIPSSIRTQYNIPENATGTNPENSQGVLEFGLICVEIPPSFFSVR